MCGRILYKTLFNSPKINKFSILDKDNRYKYLLCAVILSLKCEHIYIVIYKILNKYGRIFNDRIAAYSKYLMPFSVLSIGISLILGEN